MRNFILKAVVATAFVCLLGGTSARAGDLLLTLGGSAEDKANQEIEIYEVRKKPDGTTEEVRVTEKDGSELKIEMDHPERAIKPRSTTLPDGGAVTQNPRMAATNRVAIKLPDGVYNVRIKNKRTNETYQTGAVRVAGEDATKAKIDGSSKIVFVDPKFRPEGYEVSSSGVRNLGTVAVRQNPHQTQFSASYGHIFGSPATHVSQNGARTDGADIDLSVPTLRADGRLFLNGPLFGNLGNVGNFGNVGNTAFGLFDPFIGLQFALGLGGRDRGLNTDQHPAAGIVDTVLFLHFVGSLTPYIGAKLLDAGAAGYLNGLIGARISWWEAQFRTDETGGGGNMNVKKEDKILIGPTAALEWNIPLTPAPANGRSPEFGVQIGVWGEYLPGTSVRTTTQPFNFDWVASTQGSFAATARFGVYGRW